ncbi:recombinase family protein [Adlercreutzia sp. ZJ304]|uniref:recombinase family protein n=1 Tax=Adlercreutzia sp. ZJ304 TaxID=2709791 RepID=UPI0013ED5A0F|nr:recombinase family protein [Adlercreutzia sp. ZJ304]
MKSITTQGVICLRDPKVLFEYCIARIGYTEYEDETFEYSIKPNYSVIDLLEPPSFQGIPGINLDLHREEYIRKNVTPVFISERTPAENREDIRELLDAEGMEYLNRLEWLIRTNTRYSGDNLYVRMASETDDEVFSVSDLSNVGLRSSETLRIILEAICAGRIIDGDGFRIDDSNRGEFYALLTPIYLKEKRYIDDRRREGIETAMNLQKLGRPLKAVDQIKLIDAIDRYKNGEIKMEEALEMAKVSRATFYRRMKQFQPSQGARN